MSAMTRIPRALVATLFLNAHPALAQDGAATAGAPDSAAARRGYTAAYVVERNTGRVLFEENAHTPVPTASMAKMMTSLIVMEEIEAGRLDLDAPVTISARASEMGGSQIYAREGQVFTVETLLAATMVQSANDAAMALAEKVAGSAEGFARLMNRRAASLGLGHSTFYDPHGLPGENGNDNVMCAHDLARLGMELMRYPLMREYAAAPTLPFTNATFTSGMTNPNHLLRDYEGAYGIKTGYTGRAGFSVTAAARRGDMDVVAVVTGARSSRGPESSFGLAASLMNDAFLDWSLAAPVKKGETVGQAAVVGGATRTVAAVAPRNVTALVRAGEDAELSVAFEGREVEAPVVKGEPIGTIVLSAGGEVVARVPAVAAEAVAKRPWWKIWPLRWPFRRP